MALFRGQDLTCVRGERTVFQGLDFALDAGDMLILSGPNGSGKSSLLRLMAGLLPAASGTISWGPAPIAEDPEQHGAHLHYVGHLDAIKPVLSVTENLTFWATLHGGYHDVQDRVSSALSRLGLTFFSDTPAQFLSAGQRRRVALARVLASPAQLWLLDEPMTALDSDAVSVVESLMEDHRENGGMVVISTHASFAASDANVLDFTPFLDLTPFAQTNGKVA